MDQCLSNQVTIEKSAMVSMALSSNNNKTIDVTFSDIKIVGNGAFGEVYRATMKVLRWPEPYRDSYCTRGAVKMIFNGAPYNGDSCVVAVKKIKIEEKYKDRELHILEKLKHINIVKIIGYFKTVGENNSIFRNLVMENVSVSLHHMIRWYRIKNKQIPQIFIKLYYFQLLKALNYLKSFSICHRDLKPSNILVCSESNILKVCDFGSAKEMSYADIHVSYICSRFYRAPELIMKNERYSLEIDIWSAGCVLAEFCLLSPLFRADSEMDLMIKIIDLLGTPTYREIRSLNPRFPKLLFPKVSRKSFQGHFGGSASLELLDLLQKTLVYIPENRISPSSAMCHPFFEDLYSTYIKYYCLNRSFPPIFDFTFKELRNNKDLYVIHEKVKRLLPAKK